MNKSHQLLSASIERRLKHLMIQLLTKYEYEHPAIKETQKGVFYRNEIKTALNDVMRATRDELRDYEIEYRPLRIDEDNKLCMTADFLESIKQIEFTEKPSFKIRVSRDKLKLLNSVRDELSCGVLYYVQDSIMLEVIGITDCINRVIPIMDNYTFNPTVREKYINWRAYLVNKYIGDRDEKL